MWTGAVFMVGVFAVIATQVSGQTSSGDFEAGDCGENSTVVSRCQETFALLYGFGTPEQNCMLMLETIACVETALCHCNFSGDHPQLETGYRLNMLLYHFFNNLTQCGNETYGESIQSDVIGPIDVQEGVNCTKYNRTVGDLALSLSVSEIPVVLDVEAICPGVQDCYHQYDRGLEVALYRKDFPQFCRESAILLECLVNVSCECGQSTHDKMVNMVSTERTIYRDSCAAIVSFSAFQEIGITCPGTDICDSLDPQYNCLLEFDAAANSALTYPQYCTALFDLANCTEELACDCGFYQEPSYYRSLAIAKYNYVNATGCEPLTGPFPKHTGLNCGIDNRFTEEEKILTIALAEPEFVNAEDSTCPGIKACYDTANAKSAEAHRMKDLSAICVTEAERITCLEEAYCHCGRLNEVEVYNRLYELRVNQNNLCYDVSGFPSLIRCRGSSTCLRNDPLSVCQAEYSYDAAVGNDNYELQCQASKNYITCVEEVGCACGLLADGTSLAAETVYNFTTLTLKIYDKAGCPRLSGAIRPDVDGIYCEGTTDDDTKRKLVLSYADSSEVAALATDCSEVRDCFKTHDQSRADALMRRSYTDLCQAQSQLIGCVDNAYCVCGMNGTEAAENYITTQMTTHDVYCSEIAPIHRKPCTREVAALSEQCGSVAGCFSAYDTALTKSLPPCPTHLTLIGCLDTAYCKCKLNGTVAAERYITTEITSYSNQGCGSPNTVARKECGKKTTGAAETIRQSFGLLLMLFIAVIVM